jgi:hypothetical protein
VKAGKGTGTMVKPVLGDGALYKDANKLDLELG